MKILGPFIEASSEVTILQILRDLFGFDELLPNEWMTHNFRGQFCKPEDRRFVCLNALYSVTGFDKEQVR